MIRMALLAAASLSLAPLASAQDKPPPSSDDVVVKGIAAKDLDKQVESFVSMLAPTSERGQLTRWNGRICLTMDGLWPERRKFILGRIAEVAKAIKVQLKMAPGCTPNMFIVFTDNADAYAAKIVGNFPDYVRNTSYGGPTKNDIARYAAPRPVRWFSINRRSSPDGLRLDAMTPTGKLDAVPDGLPASRIRSGFRVNTTVKLILVDEGKVGGVQWDQLADYLAMVTLAHPQIDGNFGGTDSVMSIFAARDAGKKGPPGLTPQDNSFLTALYSAASDMDANFQRATIQGKVKKTFKPL